MKNIAIIDNRLTYSRQVLEILKDDHRFCLIQSQRELDAHRGQFNSHHDNIRPRKFDLVVVGKEYLSIHGPLIHTNLALYLIRSWGYSGPIIASTDYDPTDDGACQDMLVVIMMRYDSNIPESLAEAIKAFLADIGETGKEQ